VAIAIAGGSDVLTTRTLEWPLGRPFTGARSELLDRYLLVSQLAPQLEHLIDFVRPAYGVSVASVVACGNLPALRSLAMLLIEELDREVETLDSAELLGSSVLATEVGEIVPALQLAAAVASTAENRVPIHAADDVAPSAQPEVRDANHARPRTMSLLAALLAVMVGSGWSLLNVAGSSPARAVFQGGSLPPSIQTELSAPADPDRGLAPAKPEAALGRVDGRSVRTTGRGGRAGPSPGVPTVDGIFISGPHRLAIVNGQIVAAGDVVGTQSVARIERNGVVLRDRVGREVYVAIRTRKSPTIGS
jgi:hypothetical protein